MSCRGIVALLNGKRRQTRERAHMERVDQATARVQVEQKVAENSHDLRQYLQG